MEYIRSALYDEIASNSNVISGEEYRELVCAVSQVAADMVVKTLGPYGSTTVIDDGTGFTYPSKDGWSCLSKLQFTDPTYNTIFNMLKKISFNSVTTVGDGTTTAMVAANNFLRIMYTEFMPNILEKGSFRQADFIDTMNRISTNLEEALLNNPDIMRIDPDGDFSDIYKIAYVATNGNHEFASIIQQIYQETHNPNIQVAMDKSPVTKHEIQQGYKFDARTLNFPVYVNDDSGIINYRNHPCKIVVFDHNVTFQSHEKIIGTLSAIAQRDNIEILILAPYFDDIISSWIDSTVQRMVQNRMKPNIMLIQVPTTMELHRKTLSDLCVLTNSQIFDDAKVRAFNILLHNQTHDEKSQINDSMFSLESFTFESPEEVINRCLGTIKSIVINKTEGFIQDYEDVANQVQYNAVMAEAKEAYENLKKKAHKVIGGTLDKEYLFTQMRYIKLKGSTGIIKVGALSDIQQRCDKDALDDAVLACRSAYENGYVRGMNLEILSILYNWIKTTNHPTNDTYARDIENMLFKCFYLTSLQVLSNKQPDNTTKRLISVHDPLYDANLQPIDTIKHHLCNTEILDMAISDSRKYDYNLRTEEMHSSSMWEVVNSTATDIEILRAVVNVLTTVITSNQFLSVTRRYDPKINSERAIKNRMEEDARLITNKVNAAVNALVSNENYDMLQALFGGIHFDDDEEYPEDSGIHSKIFDNLSIPIYGFNYVAKVKIPVHESFEFLSPVVDELIPGSLFDIIEASNIVVNKENWRIFKIKFNRVDPNIVDPTRSPCDLIGYIYEHDLAWMINCTDV